MSSSSRAVLHLPAPPPPRLLKVDFPVRDYAAGTQIFRSHTHGRGPWWFSASGAGRFDLAAPHGACYVAESEVVTLLEAWGGLQVVPSYMAAERDVSQLRLDTDISVADLTSNLAVQFGVTSEIFTTADYALTQLWAAAFDQAGFGGIRYWARHDLAHTAACIALFGGAGAAALPFDDPDHVPGRTDLLRKLEDDTGITVLPVPPF